MVDASGLDLSETIEGYFVADALPDPDSVAAWFSPNAEVHDEGRTYCGAEAIRPWRVEGKAKTGSIVEPLTETQVKGRTVVSAKVAGNFPGSPVTLSYAFTIVNDLIVDLDIRP